MRERVMPVRLMIFDVDGVLTDGSIVFHDDGSELKVFDVHDGHGIKLLQRAGIEVAIITGRSCRAVEHRAAGLGISRVYQGIHRKLEAFERIMVETGFEPRQLGYMGDDLIDIPVMRRVGFSVSVPNAVAHVLPFAHYVTRARGGHGACREVCEILLRVQGLWEQVTMDYFKNPD
ncbi:MAG: HAD-IIIA family hydrolase [Syntrophobacteraceae bacterium]|nr:HAD-IIIA family hydrolase [Syntrophobacteraceae bacterium]